MTQLYERSSLVGKLGYSRFLRARLDGLLDEPRPGPPRTVTDTQVEQVVITTENGGAKIDHSATV